MFVHGAGGDSEGLYVGGVIRVAEYRIPLLALTSGYCRILARWRKMTMHPDGKTPDKSGYVWKVLLLHTSVYKLIEIGT